MTPSIHQDYTFFRDAVQAISTSLNLPEAMRGTFTFLSGHFPLAGMSLHRFEPRHNAMHILFLATQDQFHYLDAMVPLPKAAVKWLEDHEHTTKTVRVPSSVNRIIPTLHGKAIAAYLPDVDRARLAAILSTADKVVGHLSLLGPGPDSFSAEHERKLGILWPVLGLFIVNLLQYHEISELQNRLTEQNRYLTKRLHHLKQERLIGEEGGLRHIKEMIQQLGGQDVPVLITGETGTGKEVIADAIYRYSQRCQAPYVKVNCGAIPDTLIDSELFGHEKGAFTGADKTRCGRFELADRGTLFLDEVGDMPLNVQVRLLRVLQDGVFERMGGSRSIRVDVRIIAATHQNLPDLVRKGRFREDLYYRLNVFPIHVPPLRERRQDIPALIHHFITKKARLLNLPETPLLDSKALPPLLAYPWPGNARELENLVERAMVVDSKGHLRLHVHLPKSARTAFIKSSHQADVHSVGEKLEPVESDPDPFSSFPKTDVSLIEDIRRKMMPLDDLMTAHICKALTLCNGRISGDKGAARMLGVNPNTLRKRMEKHKIPYKKYAMYCSEN